VAKVTHREANPIPYSLEAGMRMLRLVAGILIVAAPIVACEEADRAPAAEDETTLPAPPAPAAPAAAPDTTAEGLWAHLEGEAYRDNWRLWPGTEQLYEGTEPHGMLLTTYANDVAYRALLDGQVADLPDGSIIVKENYMPDGTYDAATVMYRVRGYNPDHQDWLFAKYEADGAVDAFGRAPMCQACHEQAETGYVFTEVRR
jgi:hypothetical protein